jgi:hypothetical protein
MRKIVGVWSAFCVFVAVGTPVNAEERMVIQRNLLIYDLSESSGLPEAEQSILPNDHLLLSELLMENPEVDTVVVSGGGGLSLPAYEMAAKIEAFGLNTIARNTCVSACTTILLGGRERSMEPGARLGFHRGSQAANYLKEIYESQLKDQGWKDEFAFAAFIYERGEIAARDYIDFLVRRGVSVSFALRTQTFSSSDMWYPSEAELLENGVLTRRPKTAQEEAETP